MSNIKYIRPYSAFNFGGQNRRPKAENLRFGPKVSASGIPLYLIVKLFTGDSITNFEKTGGRCICKLVNSLAGNFASVLFEFAFRERF